MFGKKIKGSIELELAKDQFCNAWKGEAKNCARNFCVIANSTHYYLLYRDGKFLGTPAPRGGAIYPFSKDPLEEGGRGDLKNFHRATVVCISKTFNLQMPWGTRVPFVMHDKATGKDFRVGASGTFYLEIESSDGARNADRFYEKLASQGDPSKMTAEQLRDDLCAAYINQIGAKIQECLEELDRPISSLVGLQPGELVKISEAAYSKMKDLFEEYGLSIAEKASKGSILGRLIVMPA